MKANYVIFLALAICAQSSLLAQTKGSAGSAQTPVVQVPFVGCKSDGQVGPEQAPSGKSKAVPIRADLARQLAYYKTEQGLGVLAPRGWHCFGTYGSGGTALYVSPQPITAANLFSATWGFAGPVIEIVYELGDTSGRFGVASVIARVFPAHKAFANRVINEGIEPASSFPFGPYPGDKLTYKSNEVVEYQTPAETVGLGTDPLVRKGADPISGVAILVGDTPDLLLLSARLPSKLTQLTPAIIQQVEREAVRSSP
jgi:hypothetical protein